EATTVAQRVAQKIHRPAMVRALRDGQRRPGAERSLATAAPANLEALLGVKTPQLLVVHVQTFTVKQDVEPAITEAPACRSQLALLAPCLRQTSAVFAPASCSRRIAMICSSVKRLGFIVRLPRTDSTQIWRSFRGSGHPR